MINYIYLFIAVIALALFVIPILFRRVVNTNYVHIVQYKRKTISYGASLPAGNTYYAWPSWVPLFGVVVNKLPVYVFGCDLVNYDAYDKGRLPFTLDIKAFFRIKDSNLAAERVLSFEDLKTQLQAILQGAVRTILASEDIETILSGRAEFGNKFTKEVDQQLESWGVETVKTIELMDIRDTKDSKVINNIMDKKKSMIEKESRIEVANNEREAEIAEIAAKQAIELAQETAKQQVGIRRAEVERDIGIKREETNQLIKQQEAVTAERNAELNRVNQVRAAEIARDEAVVKAEEQAKTVEIIANGNLLATQLAAQGIISEGNAKAEAEKQMQLAPVQAQIELAREIGNNDKYQQYLINIEQVSATKDIGIAQAKALELADVKVIATANNAPTGVKSVGELFSANGGTQVGSMLEGLANTDTGKALINKLLQPKE